MAWVLVSLGVVYSWQSFYQYFTVERERRRLRRTFSQYLAPAVVEEVLKSPEAQELRGRQVEATIMFTDLAGFTSASEKLTAAQVIELANEYLASPPASIAGEPGPVQKSLPGESATRSILSEERGPGSPRSSHEICHTSEGWSGEFNG